MTARVFVDEINVDSLIDSNFILCKKETLKSIADFFKDGWIDMILDSCNFLLTYCKMFSTA